MTVDLERENAALREEIRYLEQRVKDLNYAISIARTYNDALNNQIGHLEERLHR